MSDRNLFRAVSWPVIVEQQAEWMPSGPLVMIIPDDEHKEYVGSLFSNSDQLEIYTVTELVERYAVISLGQKGLISVPFMESMISAIINSGLVPYLNMETHRHGYIKAIAAFINNFRCASTTNLKQAFFDFKIEKPGFRENDLVKIYNEYEERLSEKGFDYRSALQNFFDRVTEDNLSSGFGFEREVSLVFFGFSNLTSLEAKFFKYLLRYAPQVVFLYCTDDKVSEQAARIEASLAEVLTDFSTRQTIDLLSGDGQIDSFAPAARSLFQPTVKKHFKDDKQLCISKENNRYMEVTSIAAKIKELESRGADLSQIKVILPEYDLYSTLIGEIFPEYSIPYSLSKGLPLVSFPSAVVVNALVCQRSAANPFSLREMIFSSPYISYKTESSGPELYEYQVSAGLNLLSEQEITAKKRQGSSLIIELDYPYIKTLSRNAYRVANPPPGTPALKVVALYLDQLTWNDQTEKKDAFYKALQQFFVMQEAEKALSFGQSRLSSREFKAAVLVLLKRFNVEENISEPDLYTNLAEEQSSSDVIVEQRDRRILIEVKDLLDRLVQKIDPETSLPVSDFIRIFERLMKEARLNYRFPPGSVENGVVEKQTVSIEPVEQGHYRSADYIFICGLVDGEFPARDEFNFLQPQKEGLGLGRVYTSVDYARNRFYHLVRSTRKTLYVSAPVTYNGRMLPLSPFILELMRQLPDKQEEASGVQNAERNDLERGNTVSSREKMIIIGKNVDDNYQQAQPLLSEMHQQDPLYARRIMDILRFDGQTMNVSSLSEFDGLFFTEDADEDALGSEKKNVVLEKLAGSLAPITFTPEVIERYASCPLRFFLDNIMGLKKEPDYHPDTTEKGVLIRSFLQEYSQAAAKVGNVPDQAAEMLYESVAGYFAEREDDFTDAFEKRFQDRLIAGLKDQESRRPGLFKAFLAFENDSPERLVPYAGKLSGTINLQGQLAVDITIDRIDLAPAVDSLFIYQYSTAGTGDVSKILRGLRFDLPLALLYLFEKAEDYFSGKTVGGAGIYLVKSPKQIKRGGYLAKDSLRAKQKNKVSDDLPLFSGQREGIIDDDEFYGKVQAIGEEVLRIHKLMHKGIFHLPLCHETDQSCANCSFHRICRKDQLRLDRLYYNLQNESDLYRVKPALKY